MGDLIENSNILTKNHKVLVSDELGNQIRLDEEPLIDVLKMSTYDRATNPRIGGSGKMPDPINFTSLDLYERISRETVGLLGGRDGINSRSNPRSLSDIKVRISTWIAGLNTKYDIDNAIFVTSSWISQIRNIIQPVKKLELMLPCPSCRESYVKTLSPEGETIKSCAVNVYMYDKAFAECSACSTRWVGSEIFSINP